MTTSDTISLLAVVAAWLAIYWQRRDVKASEREMNSRVKTLEEIIARIEAERNTRETQIGERVAAHKKLELDSILSELRIVYSNSDIHLLGELIAYQQFATVYLLHRSKLDAIDPNLEDEVFLFNSSVVSLIGRRNHCRAVTNAVKTGDEAECEIVAEAVQHAVEALKKAVSAGQTLLRSLHRVGAIAWPDGSSPDDHFIPFSQAVDDLSKPLKKLEELYGIQLRTPSNVV